MMRFTIFLETRLKSGIRDIGDKSWVCEGESVGEGVHNTGFTSRCVYRET
jgi:hypothetical protein